MEETANPKPKGLVVHQYLVLYTKNAKSLCLQLLEYINTLEYKYFLKNYVTQFFSALLFSPTFDNLYPETTGSEVLVARFILLT